MKKEPKFYNIQLTEKHLRVIETACEAFTRMRLGQIDYALDEIFPKIDREDRKQITDFVRIRLFPNLQQNASYGIGQKEVEWGNEAYEIRQTIRQFLAVKRNNGYFEPMCVTTDDPLKVSNEPLPIIPEFKKYLDFKIPKTIIGKLQKFILEKKYNELWEMIDKKMKLPKHGKAEIVWNEGVVRCWKPFKQEIR